MMLTAWGFDIGPDDMIAAGIAAVLAKPFSPREVLSKVTELIDQSVDASAGERL
jgi:DNA-binding response OmpR family regulator